jgi:hypothetical protein
MTPYPGARSSRQSLSDRSHFAAPLTDLTREQRCPRRSDVVPLDRVRLTAAKSSLGRHRKLRLARPQGSGSTLTLDDGLRLARPQGSGSTSTLDDGLRLARPQGSDIASASEDCLHLARPRGSDSASTLEDRLDLDLGGASASLDLGLGPTTSQGESSLPYP